MNTILGIKFRDYGQIYFFTAPADEAAADSETPVTVSAADERTDPALCDCDCACTCEAPCNSTCTCADDDVEPLEADGLPTTELTSTPATELVEMPCTACSCTGGEEQLNCVRVGDLVVAETGQGLGLGVVVYVSQTLPAEAANDEVLPIVRVTMAADAPAIEENRTLTTDALRFCTTRIRERELDMKLVDVEVLFDKSKFIFYFTAPTRIDFRELVKDLVREYHVRIELRQIGVRHETQMLGAVGNCGMVCCCRRFLRKFAPVTIKMAKEQNLFLNPSKISGICGRLLCCLSYEQDNYDAFHRECPRLGKRYQTTSGDVKVLRANMFRNSVIVLDEAGEEQEYTLEDWRDMNPRRPDVAPQPAGRPVPDQRPRPQGDGFVVVTGNPDAMGSDDEVVEAELTPQPLSPPVALRPAEALCPVADAPDSDPDDESDDAEDLSEVDAGASGDSAAAARRKRKRRPR